MESKLGAWGMALLFLVAPPFVLSGCDRAKNFTEVEHIQRAKDFEDKGELSASVIELKNALRKNPDNAQARWMLGQIYIKTGRGAEAEKELNKAKQLGVDPEMLKVPMAEALLAQQAYKRLFEETDIPTEATPATRAKLLRLKGESQLGLGKLDQGCALFDDAIRADANYAAAYVGLAKCAVAKGDISNARIQLAHAHSLDTTDIDGWLLEGELETQLNNIDAAVAAYNQALKINPNNIAALTGHAYTALQKKDTVSAKQDIERAKKLLPNSSPVKYLEGLIAFSEGNLEASRDKAQEILSTAPNYPSALLLLGLAAYGLKEYETAQSNLFKVLEWQPANLEVRKLLAGLVLKSGDGAKTLDLLKPALIQHPTDTQLLVLAADASAMTGQWVTAKKLYADALKQKPDDVRLQIALAQTFLASGDSQKAIDQLTFAVKHDIADYQANKMLVSVLVQQRRYDEALAVAKTLLKKLPSKALPYNLEGTVYTAKNDLVSARKSFEQAISTEPGDHAGQLNLAQLDMAENRLGDARRRLEKLTQAEQPSVPGLLLLADLDRSEGKEKEYLESLQRILKVAPDTLSARIQLMRYHLAKNDPKSTLTYANAGVEYGAANSEYLMLMGEAQMAAGEPNAAVTTYQKLLQISPNVSKAHLAMARAQAAAGNFVAMQNEARQALKLDPGDPDALTGMAMLEARSGNVAAARKHAATLQSLYPKLPVGYALEGDILLHQNKPEEAAKFYEKAHALAPNGNTILSLFDAYYRAGKKSAAFDEIGAWLKSHPDDHRVRAYLAAAYSNDRRYRDAATHLEYILSKTPDNFAVQNDLALIYFELRDARALPLAEKAYVQQPKVPQVADTYGWLLVNRGQPEKGLEVLRKAASAAPKDLSIKSHLAQALIKTNNYAEARRTLEEIAKAGTPVEVTSARELLEGLK